MINAYNVKIALPIEFTILNFATEAIRKETRTNVDPKYPIASINVLFIITLQLYKKSIWYTYDNKRLYDIQIMFCVGWPLILAMLELSENLKE